jgi:hypothetical protein
LLIFHFSIILPVQLEPIQNYIFQIIEIIHNGQSDFSVLPARKVNASNLCPDLPTSWAQYAFGWTFPKLVSFVPQTPLIFDASVQAQD